MTKKKPVSGEAFSKRLDEELQWEERFYTKESQGGGFNPDSGTVGDGTYHRLPAPTLDEQEW